eukprot:4581785-Alexandrium_andersonii.AAC.1
MASPAVRINYTALREAIIAFDRTGAECDARGVQPAGWKHQQWRSCAHGGRWHLLPRRRRGQGRQGRQGQGQGRARQEGQGREGQARW